jgi:hypothetical protein
MGAALSCELSCRACEALFSDFSDAYKNERAYLIRRTRHFKIAQVERKIASTSTIILISNAGATF